MKNEYSIKSPECKQKYRVRPLGSWFAPFWKAQISWPALCIRASRFACQNFISSLSRGFLCLWRRHRLCDPGESEILFTLKKPQIIYVQLWFQWAEWSVLVRPRFSVGLIPRGAEEPQEHWMPGVCSSASWFAGLNAPTRRCWKGKNKDARDSACGLQTEMWLIFCL